VFIIVCKTTKLAKVIYDWLAEDEPPFGVPPARLEGFRNGPGAQNTIRVDTRVVHETDTGGAKSDESAWMRLTLDTVGKTEWPRDRQGRPLYPEGFEELARKLERPLHPPGRDVRCIVSVAMLTEGWDCNTVTHIIGLRPFMSQLLCEQVVGRGLRRASYEVDEHGRLSEEVAKVLGVPFEIVPFKANPRGPRPEPPKRHYVHALPEREALAIRFPRVEGYRQVIRRRVRVDWTTMPRLVLNPRQIPPEMEMMATLPANRGRPSLMGPGRLESVTLNPYRAGRRVQALVFELARELTRGLVTGSDEHGPTHVLFPQVARIVARYLEEFVEPLPPAEPVDVSLAPYYGWVVERLSEAIRPGDDAGGRELPRYEENRPPGSTAEVEFWTSRDVREVRRSHVNLVVADTKVWEQSAAYHLDTHERVFAFVKNAGLGLAVPYLHNGQPHDYVPDFVVRLRGQPELNLILEAKGYDPLEEIKVAAAHRWVNAVNADGGYGRWAYALVKKPEDVRRVLDEVEEHGRAP
jgi:type III restriction enzyme